MNIFEKIFRGRSEHLHWSRLNHEQVVDENLDPVAPPTKIEPDGGYVSLTATEMYLRHSRKLWRKSYPLLHCFTRHAGPEQHSVAGPGQLTQLGESNLERVIVVNQRLAGPLPFTGEDLTFAVGLYAIPGEGYAKALIDTVSTIGSLAGLALGTAVKLASVVKDGVESIIGADEARLRLGVQDTIMQGQALITGTYIGIGGPTERIETEKLWLKGHSLVTGEDPVVAAPYEAHDYVVVQISALQRRHDWRKLPGIARFDARFKQVMSASGSADQKQNYLARLWPTFTQALRNSEHLISADAEAICAEVGADLKARLESMRSGNIFETRSRGEASSADPGDFDFATIEPGSAPDAEPPENPFEGD